MRLARVRVFGPPGGFRRSRRYRCSGGSSLVGVSSELWPVRECVSDSACERLFSIRQHLVCCSWRCVQCTVYAFECGCDLVRRRAVSGVHWTFLFSPAHPHRRSDGAAPTRSPFATKDVDGRSEEWLLLGALCFRCCAERADGMIGTVVGGCRLRRAGRIKARAETTTRARPAYGRFGSQIKE